MRLTGLLIALLVVSPAHAATDVWMDIDPANGVGEIDDGLMLFQAFHSPEIELRGVSVCFGNAPLRYAKNIGYNIVKVFGPEGLPYHVGAESEDEFGEANDAVRAMADALRERPMTILAVGPVTNVGSLVKRHPELHDRIEAIVVVAGRRPGQRFVTTEKSKANPPRDFNFESDVPAMQAILDSDIRFVMAPWEVSSKVWVTREDVAAMRGASPAGTFIYQTSQHWIDRWEAARGVAAFNPYDALALGWVSHPHLVEGMNVHVAIEQGPDERDPSRTKSYLHVYETDSPKRPALYLHTPKPGFKPMLLDRLRGPTASSSGGFDHSRLDALLSRHVDDRGMIDYAAIAADPASLDAYIASLADVDLDAMDRDTELALLINAYNACTIRLICDDYPVASIKDIPAPERWKAARWNIGGNVWSLDDIEHEQIRRRFDEPRIHFALVCAAQSCPPLRDEAYVADRLDAQLEDQTRYIHNRDQWFRFDRADGVLHLTPLYKWYGSDFGDGNDAVTAFAARYSSALREARRRGRAIDVRWLDYDWSLNEQ